MHATPGLNRPVALSIKTSKSGLGCAALGLVFGLSACVSHHLPPAGAPTATLVLDSNQTLMVQAFRNAACESSDAGTRIAFLHPTAGDRLRGTAKPIAAGQPLVVGVHMNVPQGGQMASCNVTSRFTPVAGGVYHLTFRYDPLPRNCQVVLLKRGDQGSLEPEPSHEKLPARCENSVNG